MWQLGAADEYGMEKTLPVNCTFPIPPPKDPWLLHSMTVNTLNFCSFAMCYDSLPASSVGTLALEANSRARPILIAIPNTINSGGVRSSCPNSVAWNSNKCCRLISFNSHQRSVSQSYKRRRAQILVCSDHERSNYLHDIYYP